MLINIFLSIIPFIENFMNIFFAFLFIVSGFIIYYIFVCKKFQSKIFIKFNGTFLFFIFIVNLHLFIFHFFNYIF